MRSLLTPIAVAALVAASSGFAQLDVTDVNSGPLYELLDSMTDGKSALFGPHTGVQEYDRIVWDFSQERFFTDRGGADPLASVTGSYLDFTRNPAAACNFFGRDFYLGFFGNESRDDNAFGFTAGGTDFLIAQYRREGDPDRDAAPKLRHYEREGFIKLDFFHDDAFVGERSVCTDPTHFAIFFAEWNGLPYWLFTIDDRGDQLIDFDDGLFLLTSDVESGLVIPEPSTIGLLAVGGLLLMACLRARKRRK